MGLIVPQTVKVRIGSINYQYYKEKGYTFKKRGDIIEVNVLDLHPGSKKMVKCTCDICGKEIKIRYMVFIENRKKGILVSCRSNSCTNKKREDTCMKKYGVKNVVQLQEVKNKMQDTNLGRYGSKSPLGSKEIQDKIKQTMLNNYGVEHALQNRELLNKALDSFQFNGTGPCSRAQKYIHFLIGGVLNKRVCNSLVDICFEKEKIAIEYDGSGHFLGELIVNKDRSISKEAILREKNREDSIVNKGYKVIRFIATKDRIPSDEVILNLVEGFKNSDFKVIRINFEEGTIDRDYKEKWYCNFGKLRRITKEDLEQFESKKTINLK